jgi:hypothetical protein
VTCPDVPGSTCQGSLLLFESVAAQPIQQEASSNNTA